MHLQMLRTLYSHSANGLPLLGVPAEEARRLQQEMSPTEAADRLIYRAVALSGATGFVCGLPGYLAMPLTIPSNVAGVLLIQFHMCAALAALDERDPHDIAVRERAIQCVLDSDAADHEEPHPSDDEPATGPGPKRSDEERDDENSSENEILSMLGRVTMKVGERGMRFIGERAIRWAYRTARQANRKSRSLPFFGGAIGAVTDGMETQSVGQRARRVFLNQPVARS